MTTNKNLTVTAKKNSIRKERPEKFATGRENTVRARGKANGEQNTIRGPTEQVRRRKINAFFEYTIQ